MQNLYVASYHHIDFWIEPKTSVDILIRERMLPCTEQEAATVLKRAGWEGDGKLSYIWIPPFMIDHDTHGMCVWHVKQHNNGTSWLCSEMPFNSPGIPLDEWTNIGIPI